MIGGYKGEGGYRQCLLVNRDKKDRGDSVDDIFKAQRILDRIETDRETDRELRELMREEEIRLGVFRQDRVLSSINAHRMRDNMAKQRVHTVDSIRLPTLRPMFISPQKNYPTNHHREYQLGPLPSLHPRPPPSLHPRVNIPIHYPRHIDKYNGNNRINTDNINRRIDGEGGRFYQLYKDMFNWNGKIREEKSNIDGGDGEDRDGGRVDVRNRSIDIKYPNIQSLDSIEEEKHDVVDTKYKQKTDVKVKVNKKKPLNDDNLSYQTRSTTIANSTPTQENMQDSISHSIIAIISSSSTLSRTLPCIFPLCRSSPSPPSILHSSILIDRLQEIIGSQANVKIMAIQRRLHAIGKDKERKEKLKRMLRNYK